MALSKELKILLGLFLGIMVAVVLLESAANPVNTATSSRIYNNQSITLSGVGINNVTLEGKNFEGTPVVSGMKNFTTWGIFTATNYTIYQITENGKQVVKIGVLSNSTGLAYNTVNVTYTFQPYGYVSESGGRTITTLILVTAALGILVFVVVGMWKKAGNILGMGRKTQELT